MIARLRTPHACTDRSIRRESGNHGFSVSHYLPELDLYIEYWGTDTADYKIGMLKKHKL